tara:strand:+ start:5186 stop:5410 length:225 start_codon:yes stop_codon:yes gene_type:complete
MVFLENLLEAFPYVAMGLIVYLFIKFGFQKIQYRHTYKLLDEEKQKEIDKEFSVGALILTLFITIASALYVGEL